ncbi:hypothetical protein LUD75_04315 [Epilithonimonas sp. JDS]|uniref:hypothetical protein n=1 Tax=Epilithonimonas sp. JDS TaxID=2902797 RepID=UPI001E3F7EE7|nr:hypothetical protein [Epilithonimonas sp. JDS]MCD9853913.1 hypothetical protein [Epilithonimonas sp. JDS]
MSLLNKQNKMRKMVYAIVLVFAIVSGLAFSFAPFASGPGAKIKNETTKKAIPKPLSEIEKKAAMKKWEATPDGVMYRKWVASPAGQKVIASTAKISKSVRDYTDMPAVVTSLSLPPGSRLGFAMMVRIDADDYILTFDPKKSQLAPLESIKVNDKIVIRSHYISHAPKYSYPIIIGDYVIRDGQVIFKRAPRKGGC